jgi:hypothetical protein
MLLACVIGITLSKNLPNNNFIFIITLQVRAFEDVVLNDTTLDAYTSHNFI